MSQVASCVMDVLCQHHGRLEFGQLKEILGRKTAVANHVLVKELLDESKFLLVNTGLTSDIHDFSVVIAKTMLRVCQNVKCLGCDGFLHLCRYFACGRCRFGDKCKNPHSLDATSTGLLRKMGLSERSVEDLCLLLLQNDPYLLPEICAHYNKGNGEHGSCRFQSKCTSLHVCQHFLLGDCRFGAACKRAHTFDGSSSVKILNGRGLSPDNMRNLQLIYRNRLLLSGERPAAAIIPKTPSARSPVKEPEKPPPVAKAATTKAATTKAATTEAAPARQLSNTTVSEADRNEICLYFIRQGCSFKDKCIRVHHRLPYKWQILDQDGETWRDLASQEEIEKTYCNPANDKSVGPKPVNFLTMTCVGSPVRRLSTASSVTKPPHFILTTEWRWYWKDDQGGWNEYGLESDPKHLATITSQSLENVYLAGIEDEIDFTSGRHGYVLHLKGMYQQNLKHKTRREVRRRPHFISAQDVDKKLKSGSTEASASSPVNVPAHWDKAALPKDSYKLVPLSASSEEFQRVESLFRRTMQKSTIHSIKRVQNLLLWRDFTWQRDKMKVKAEQGDVREMELFHGTDQASLDAICEQNFDWRICGVHGSSYGKGSYFARHASYSDRFSAKGNGSRKSMFVARVLVGDFTQGKSAYLRPPARESGKGIYDSCVDLVSNPSIFVIFEKYQVYPEFIVEYS